MATGSERERWCCVAVGEVVAGVEEAKLNKQSNHDHGAYPLLQPVTAAYYSRYSSVFEFHSRNSHHPYVMRIMGCYSCFVTANAASGMAVHDDCKLKFLELKAKRTYRFIVFKIEEKQKQVIVEKVGEPAESYEDFTASLPDRLVSACFYYHYRLCLIYLLFAQRSPDTSRVRSKMIYASSKDRFKRELDGIQVELQATDPTEIGLDVIKSRVDK
ncbi:hypothetical protein TEA_019724 [Camellia sinensis var. sinensis]|uniref:ADF-H domain-containing protein n=1 Tax=Camellia sinensis var. sinensis TaxID=542762 RepID=A0A4S4E1Q5_CAMSN|nr:hypothetical protein TEA_019724 [Camellia sinensis var. sinensis]